MATFEPCPWRAELQRASGKTRVSGPCLSGLDRKCYLCGESRRGMKRHSYKSIQRAAELKSLAFKTQGRAEARQRAEDQAGAEWLGRQLLRIADELDLIVDEDTDRRTIAMGKISALLDYESPGWKRLRSAMSDPPHRRCSSCGKSANGCVVMRYRLPRCCEDCRCEEKCRPELLAAVERMGIDVRGAADRSREVREDLKLSTEQKGSGCH